MLQLSDKRSHYMVTFVTRKEISAIFVNPEDSLKYQSQTVPQITELLSLGGIFLPSHPCWHTVALEELLNWPQNNNAPLFKTLGPQEAVASIKKELSSSIWATKSREVDAVLTQEPRDQASLLPPTWPQTVSKPSGSHQQNEDRWWQLLCSP